MTEQERKLEEALEKARNRFAPYFYTIKDSYREPDAPFFCPAYMLGALKVGKILTPPNDSTGGFEKHVGREQ